MVKFPRISELMVLQSAAGYYIGRLYYYNEEEYQPYSRESAYMVDKEVSKLALIDNTYVENLR
jgi:hypothetical protein